MNGDPRWLEIARGYIGVKETPGPATTPIIGKWLRALRAWWSDDATPWCGTFVATVMQQAGQPIPKAWYRAKEWAAWGTPCLPALGAVVVFERTGGGHVGLLVGVDHMRHTVQILGGNQGDAVSIATFPVSRIVGIRWPTGVPVGLPAPPVGDSAPLSTNEA